MRYRTSFIALLITAQSTNAQYQGEGVRYQVLPLQRLDSVLSHTPEAFLLDVRSIGEFTSTDEREWLNIGRIQGATNVPIDSVEKPMWFELVRPHKNDPVFVYCWTSQRSRDVSRFLADSGFTNVINVAGGLSEYWKDQGPMYAGLEQRLQNELPYHLLNGHGYVEWVKAGAQVVDVREDSLYNGTIKSEVGRSYGRLAGSVNIPFKHLKARLSGIDLARPIIVVDDDGGTSPKAARMLIAAGASKVSVLFRGIQAIKIYGEQWYPAREMDWENFLPYELVSMYDLRPGANPRGGELWLDIRQQNEYDNNSEQEWKNVGHLAHALHIPSAELEARKAELPKDRSARILLFGFSAGREVYDAARVIHASGYSNVAVLVNGIFGLRWAAHNIAGCEAFDDALMDVPEQ